MVGQSDINIIYTERQYSWILNIGAQCSGQALSEINRRILLFPYAADRMSCGSFSSGIIHSIDTVGTALSC